MIQDTEKFKMDLVSGLERSLGEKVKPSESGPIFQQIALKRLTFES